MKIDMFAHVCPQKYVDSFAKHNSRGLSWKALGGDATIMGGRTLFETERRLEVMERLEDYAQVLVPIGETFEWLMNPQDSAILAQSYNNALSEWFDKYPGKFLGAAASIPMNNIDAALKEIETLPTVKEPPLKIRVLSELSEEED